MLYIKNLLPSGSRPNILTFTYLLKTKRLKSALPVPSNVKYSAFLPLPIESGAAKVFQLSAGLTGMRETMLPSRPSRTTNSPHAEPRMSTEIVFAPVKLKYLKPAVEPFTIF